MGQIGVSGTLNFGSVSSRNRVEIGSETGQNGGGLEKTTFSGLNSNGK